MRVQWQKICDFLCGRQQNGSTKALNTYFAHYHIGYKDGRQGESYGTIQLPEISSIDDIKAMAKEFSSVNGGASIVIRNIIRLPI